MTTAATWRKTKQGTWVVYATWADLDKAKFETGSISVTAKSGTTRDVAIEDIGNPFTVDGVQMAYGYPKAEPRQSHGTSNLCDNCGQRPGRYQRVDSSGIGGMVCGQCNREDQYSLSFC
jgi:hypothetical protein